MKSQYGVYLVPGGPGHLVRSWTVIPLYCLLKTSPRWPFWSQFCTAVSVSGLASSFRQRFAFSMTFDLSRYRYAIPQGTAIPRWAFFNITVIDLFLPSVDVLMLTLDAKSSANQTYDDTTMKFIGGKFDLKPTSSTLFTRLTRDTRGVATTGQHRYPYVPNRWPKITYG